MAKDIKAIQVKMRRLILDGLRPTEAAVLSGISRDTYYEWKNNKPTFATFIDEAESDLEHLWLKQIKKIGRDTKNAQALIKLLEARFKENWSPVNRTELTGADGQSVVFKVDASGGYIPPNNVLGVTSTLTTSETVRSKIDSEPS